MAFMYIQKGADFYGTNDDRGNSIGQSGFKYPGGGTMVMGLAWAASKKTPNVLGKPNTLGLEMILKVAKTEVEKCLMIGDRLDTDIQVGIKLS